MSRSLLAQSIGRAEERLIVEDTFATAKSKSLHLRPIGDVIVELGKSFVGMEYMPGTLELPGEEKLVVCFDGFDCVTLCETLLALARCVKLEHQSYNQYCQELQRIRYREGIIDGYPSRLHYFSDWIYDNERKGIVHDITVSLGGKAFAKRIYFMSSHVSSYAKLKDHPQFIDTIRKQEKEISQRKRTFLRKSDLKIHEKEIQSGDLLAFTSSKEGLDVAHTGIAIREQGALKLLHAPQAGEQVQITKESLNEYLSRRSQMTGLLVARPLDPS